MLIRVGTFCLLPVVSPVISLKYVAVCPTSQVGMWGRSHSIAGTFVSYGNAHPCSSDTMVDPSWTSLGTAQLGVLPRLIFLVRFISSLVQEAVILCQVLVQYRVCSVV